MSMNFKKIASAETVLSRVCEGRTKVTQEELMKRFPDGMTIAEFDFVPMTDKNKPNEEPKPVPVLAIAEDASVFFFGGAILARICDAWVCENGGDIERTSNELKASGGVKMKFTATKTRGGNNFTAAEIL